MPKRKKSQPTVQQQLIDAIVASEYSQKRIAELADIAQPSINAFVHGHRGLSLDGINRLCQVLQLELKPIK